MTRSSVVTLCWDPARWIMAKRPPAGAPARRVLRIFCVRERGDPSGW